MFNQQVLSSDVISEPVRTALATLRQHIDITAVNQAINWLEQSEQHHILTCEHAHFLPLATYQDYLIHKLPLLAADEQRSLDYSTLRCLLHS